MRLPIGRILTIALLVALPVTARAETSDPWARWRFFLGEWVAAATADPQAGTGGSTFALELDGKILVRRNRADYPATPGRAAVSHRDLLIVYPGACDSLFRAIYFDNEGHVIPYRVVAPATGRSVTFDSEENGSASRYRLIYERQEDGGLSVAFFMGPSAGELSRYATGTLRRTGTPSGR